MSIPTSQFIPAFLLPPSNHKFVFYICLVYIYIYDFYPIIQTFIENWHAPGTGSVRENQRDRCVRKELEPSTMFPSERPWWAGAVGPRRAAQRSELSAPLEPVSEWAGVFQAGRREESHILGARNSWWKHRKVLSVEPDDEFKSCRWVGWCAGHGYNTESCKRQGQRVAQAPG